MIWKSTSLFGIGKATSHENGMMCIYIVARYRVKGNSPGGFKLNVPKGAFDFGYCESLGKTHRRNYNSNPTNIKQDIRCKKQIMKQ